MKWLLPTLCLGVAIGVGMLSAGSMLCLCCGWIAACMLTCLVRAEKSGYLLALLTGLIGNGIGLYWLWPTAQKLSGQNVLIVSLLFLVITGYHALQMPAFLLVYRTLPRALDTVALRSTLAWISIEVLPFRLFPWRVGHSQWAFTSLIQIAELGGVMLITFLMFWTCEALLTYKSWRTKILPLLLIGLTVVFGTIRQQQFLLAENPSVSVALVQAAATESDDGYQRYERLRVLSDTVASDPALIIWPEGSLPFEVHESVYNRQYEPRLPDYTNKSSILMGGNTYRRPNRLFNSAVLIGRGGEIPLPYHKQVPIPFGEYIPFESQLPWLRVINPTAKGLNHGTEQRVFEVTDPQHGTSSHVAPLICYEDLFPSIGLRAVQHGADLLVSLSDDSWAPDHSEIPLKQHYLLSAFRSVEFRRTLLRNTSTGITSITGPEGALREALPAHSDGVLTAAVPLETTRTVYATLGADRPWYLLTIAILSCVLIQITRALVLRVLGTEAFSSLVAGVKTPATSSPEGVR